MTSNSSSWNADGSVQLTGIEFPGDRDVLCTRGGSGGASGHRGNLQFRLLVESYKDSYRKASNKYQQVEIATKVVQLWRHQTPVGRFLKPMPASVSYDQQQLQPEQLLWEDIGDKLAIIKAGQQLRERRLRCSQSDGGQRFTVITRPAVVTPPFGEDEELEDSSSSTPRSSSLNNSNNN